MCGISGIWDARSSTAERLAECISVMTGTLEHRGPDDQGQWLDAPRGLALGHRRLSILDLSSAGRQPMESPCGRFQLVFNGEVYNYRELRDSLKSSGASFRGQSDTEVLSTAISMWGLEETMRRAVGMWSLASWDTQKQTLTLVRDRLGIKPLYYGWQDQRLLFGSELKALKAHPDFSASVDRGAVAQFLRYGYIPAPQTIYKGVYKLAPGAMVEVATAAKPPPAPTIFWSMAETACQPRRKIGDPEAIQELQQTLNDAVALRMISDVPLGAFLSGGIDSSLVVAAMQQQSDSPVKTFCIGFEEEAYDESRFAQQVANHLGTEHHAFRVTAQEARDVIPQLASVYDEPFADSSQIPTMLVSRLAREHVTVCLSGDGGDELFGGYARYKTFANRWKSLARLTSAGRKMLASGARLAASVTPRGLADKLRRRALGLDVHSPSELYAIHNAHWKDADQIVLGDPEELRCRWSQPPCPLSPEETWMATDGSCYLPDDLLVKVDRASMAVGLEARVPLLDHRVVELAWSLPWSFKVRDGQSKWLLRETLSRHLPRPLFERPKMGFGVPIGQWLRGPLRDWADDLLAPERLASQQLLNVPRVTDIWQRHRSGSQNWEYMLWDILILQEWLETWGGASD